MLEVGETATEITLTVKLAPLLARPPTVTVTFPVVAPLGTVAAMLVLVQLVGVAVVPLKLRVLLPWLAPKLVPVIVTGVPTAPALIERLVIAGATAKGTPLLASPPTVMMTFPVDAPFGTGAITRVLLQLVGVAGVALKLTVLFP